MKTVSKSFIAAISGIAIALLAPFAHADVQNGGFETLPPLTLWTVASGGFCSVSVSTAALDAHGGNNSAAFSCPIVGFASLTQTFDAPASSTLEFWLRLEGTAVLADLSVILNGANGFSLDAVGGANNFSLYHANGSPNASGTGNQLTFTFSKSLAEAVCGISGVNLDDVNARGPQSVPEPGTLMLVGAALAWGALFRRRKQI